ncbi:unnamed protein product [Lactuca saligna]|uniref:Uncharacterized protein n=1 Tax=Lactuca saligna TaxID=75948 RepID=A0AA36A4C1_LACSI|nr:unnamed protein product [Lactuca saligna]
MEVKVKKQGEQMVVEELRRKVFEADVAWLLHKGYAHMMDQVIESVEFLLGVWQMKEKCMAANVEGGKQVIREHVVTDFASYLHLFELVMEGLCQLCNDPDAEENQPEGSSSKVGPSSGPLGK